MPKFKVGDRVRYIGASDRWRGIKSFTVEDTRDIYTNNAIKLKEVPGNSYWNAESFTLIQPIQLENK